MPPDLVRLMCDHPPPPAPLPGEEDWSESISSRISPARRLARRVIGVRVYRPKYATINNRWHMALVPWVWKLDGAPLKMGVWADEKRGAACEYWDGPDGNVIVFDEDGKLYDMLRVVRHGTVEIVGKTLAECIAGLWRMTFMRYTRRLRFRVSWKLEKARRRLTAAIAPKQRTNR